MRTDGGSAIQRIVVWIFALACAVGLPPPPAHAQDPPRREPELLRPFVCSSLLKKVPREHKNVCEVTPKKVKIKLVAEFSEINVGGYKVKTENYNGTYVPPIVLAEPGDIVAASLRNMLPPRDPIGVGHIHSKQNLTNLHYFHGGIVKPNNARSKQDPDGSKGNGDNIYVRLAPPGTFEYTVPIPGEDKLDAGVLESEKVGTIAHPLGLNWFHSHMHGRSSDQVMGGLSGLLSVGPDKANLRAKCPENATDAQCKDRTKELKRRTTVRYALLRDISLRNISALPVDVPRKPPFATADWAPEVREFLPNRDGECRASWTNSGSEPGDADADLRKGFCLRDPARYPNSAWLFTLNGQRFPTITVEQNQNLLLRIGNLSSNVAYWLELRDAKKKVKRFTILSIDGVVPAKPDTVKDIDAVEVDDFLLMPASRVEIYISNDNEDKKSAFYVLRTKGLNAGTDQWPEIQLAQVELKPNPGARKIAVARNAPTLQPPLFTVALSTKKELEKAERPKGCVRDLKKGEHRRVTFWGPKLDEKTKIPIEWSVSTEIRVPTPRHPANPGFDEEEDFVTDMTASIGKMAGRDLRGIPFTDYVKADESVDWDGPDGPDQGKPRHVCIELDNDRDPALRRESPSYQQLWILRNNTGSLHNFHIHQMKFRLARKDELKDKYGIVPLGDPSTCPDKNCGDPDYKRYETGAENPETYRWHDTIPIPANDIDYNSVYIIMSFTAEEQIGRYVFHCHILKHEDMGLMAPMEVWAKYKVGRGGTAGDVDR